jgi:uncharacterized protein (DUF885 family)
MTELKTIDPKSKTFIANGKTYFIEDKLSYNRWLEYQKLEVELTFDISFEALFDKLNEAYALLNQQRFADSSVCIRDLMVGVASNIDKRVHPAYAMCALFINTEDEDRTEIDEHSINIKIDDWNKEGYSIQTFFSIALNIVPGFIKVLSQDIQDISAQYQETMKKKSMSTKKPESTLLKKKAQNSSTR